MADSTKATPKPGSGNASKADQQTTTPSERRPGQTMPPPNKAGETSQKQNDFGDQTKPITVTDDR